jgi:hypothetical protein
MIKYGSVGASADMAHSSWSRRLSAHGLSPEEREAGNVKTESLDGLCALRVSTFSLIPVSLDVTAAEERLERKTELFWCSMLQPSGGTSGS